MRLSSFICIAAMAFLPVATAQTVVAPPPPKEEPAQTGLPPAAVPQPGLPMWVIRDADSTIYITGTIHLLPGSVGWRSERLDAALKEASTLYLELAEIGDPEGPARYVQPIVETYAATDGPGLKSKLSPEDYELLHKALKDAELPAEAVAKVDTLAPWYAIYVLNRTPYMNADYSTGNGIDVALAKTARSLGHPVKGMEAIEDQIMLSAILTDSEQLAALRDMLRTSSAMKEGQRRVTDLAFGSWARGETNMIEAMVAMMNMGGSSDRLLKNRNERWAARIESMLQGSGVSFIAVGAAHLVGPDSLQQRLKLRGIEAKPY